MRLEGLSKDDMIVGGLALALAIDLLFLPWFSYLIFSLSATDAPDGWAGILAVLASLAIVADLLIERLSPQTTLPNFGGSRTETRLRLAVVATVFIAIKFIFNVHFSLFGFGFWAGIVLCGGLVFATLRISRDQPLLHSS